MKSLSIAKNVLWTHLGSLIQIVFGLLLPPFLIREIGETHYGIYALGLSLGGFVGIANFGLYDASSRYIARFNSLGQTGDVNRIITTMLSFYLAASVVMTFLFWWMSPVFTGFFNAIDPAEKGVAIAVFRIFALNFGLSLIRNNLLAIPQALHRFDIFSLTTSSGYLLTALFSVGAVLAGYGLQGIAWGFTLATACSLFALLFHLHFTLPDIRLGIKFHPAMFRLLLGFGIYTWTSWFLQQITQQAPRFLIGRYGSLPSVTAFAVPENLSTRVKSIIRQTGFVLLPKFSEHKQALHHRELLRIANWVLQSVSIAFFVPAALLIPSFLALWINPEFAGYAGATAQIICISQMFCGAEYPFQAFLKGQNRPGLTTLYHAAVTCTLMLSAYFLITRYGRIGAAFSLFAYTPWLVVGLAVSLSESGHPAPVRELINSFFLPSACGLLYLWTISTLTPPGEFKSYVSLITYGAMLSSGLFLGLALLDAVLRGRKNSALWVIVRHSLGRRIS